MVSLIPGRFQPFHKGHIELIKSAIKDGFKPIVLVRDTKKSKDNPYTYEQRRKMIRKVFPKIRIIKIPDFREIRYGRKVGYKITKVRLPKKIESISATKIRNETTCRLWKKLLGWI